jgi:hypothetical protein
LGSEVQEVKYRYWMYGGVINLTSFLFSFEIGVHLGGFMNYKNKNEENNQQNALINSSINLLMSDHSDMFRLPS